MFPSLSLQEKLAATVQCGGAGGGGLLNEGRAFLGVGTPSLVPPQGGPGSGDKANGDKCVCVCRAQERA